MGKKLSDCLNLILTDDVGKMMKGASIGGDTMFLRTYQIIVDKVVPGEGNLLSPFGGIIFKGMHFRPKKETAVLTQIWDQCSANMLDLQEIFHESGLQYEESRVLANTAALKAWEFGRNLCKKTQKKKQKKTQPKKTETQKRGDDNRSEVVGSSFVFPSDEAGEATEKKRQKH